MQTERWIYYLLLASCVCYSEARYKFGRPLSTSVRLPPQMLKKPFPITHRLSMGHTFNTGAHVGHKRLPSKPANYRIRRPPMYNGLATTALYQVPIYNVIDNYGSLSQRLPVKEFHSMNKVPDYNVEYRPAGSGIVSPTRRDETSDDKSAIHTIPAPNLSLADKPHIILEAHANNPDQGLRNRYSNDQRYYPNVPAANFGFGSSMTSVAPQITATSSSTPTVQNHYEVTEIDPIGSKDDDTAGHPFIYTPQLDATRLGTTLNPDFQTNVLYVNQLPAGAGVTDSPNFELAGTNVRTFGQSNAPRMHTNMHSSLHVGFPGTAGQVQLGHLQQQPQFHTGYSADAGPHEPLPVTQFEDLFNSFPERAVNDQYTIEQEPKSQLVSHNRPAGQLFQPTGGGGGGGSGGSTSFSRPAPQMQQQEQQLSEPASSGRHDYTPGRVTADYNLNPEPTGHGQRFNIHIDDIRENSVNNEQLETYRNSEVTDQIDDHHRDDEDDDSNYEKIQAPYLNNVRNGESTSTQFYMALPNKNAAEKLAALAAAGDVNSHLIEEIRKQQQQQQQHQQNQQRELENEQDIPLNDEPDPVNHNDSKYETDRHQHDDHRQQERYDDEEQSYDEKQ